MEVQELGEQIAILKWIQVPQIREMNGNPRVPRKLFQSPLISSLSCTQQETWIGLSSFCELPWLSWETQLKILRIIFPIKTMLQEIFPSFQTKRLVNSYCLSDPLKVFQLKNRHWTISNNEFLMHKKILSGEDERHEREKKYSVLLCPQTSYHQASILIHKIKPQMPPLQLIVIVQKDARKTLNMVSVTWWVLNKS